MFLIHYVHSAFLIRVITKCIKNWQKYKFAIITKLSMLVKENVKCSTCRKFGGSTLKNDLIYDTHGFQF